ncbi:MAG: thiamine phosphate synthase [Parvularculaceae bacterium]
MNEGCRTRSARLAAVARALQAAGGPLARTAPFSLAFLTDRRRSPRPELIARALPAGAAIVYRDYDDPKREASGALLRTIAAGRALLFLVGGDVGLARRLGADGVHLRSRDLRAWTGGWPGVGLVSAACHSADELALARSCGADAVFLSPVFATGSHRVAPTLGSDEFKRLAERASIPVLALGGVDENNARRLSGPNVSGLGAIGAFARA